MTRVCFKQSSCQIIKQYKFIKPTIKQVCPPQQLSRCADVRNYGFELPSQALFSIHLTSPFSMTAGFSHLSTSVYEHLSFRGCQTSCFTNSISYTFVFQSFLVYIHSQISNKAKNTRKNCEITHNNNFQESTSCPCVLSSLLDQKDLRLSLLLTKATCSVRGTIKEWEAGRLHTGFIGTSK